MVADPGKLAELKSLLNRRRTGVPLVDAHKLTGLSYSTIEHHARKWGFKIEKTTVVREWIVKVIKKDETVYVNNKIEREVELKEMKEVE
jgi:hypothetical protein